MICTKVTHLKCIEKVVDTVVFFEHLVQLFQETVNVVQMLACVIDRRRVIKHAQQKKKIMIDEKDHRRRRVAVSSIKTLTDWPLSVLITSYQKDGVVLVGEDLMVDRAL